ncbi:MAG: HAD family hydrolase [Tannerella sp.]|jgi:phosphoglycolate phosphatase|nr:HAD family hydrolase [Tannerella sp.]
MKSLVIFDLDGTLLDTIADLGEAANYALSRLGYPVHAPEAYPGMVGNGIDKLLERALPLGEGSAENVLRLRRFFIPYYDVHNADHSRPYPGIPQLLADLQAAGLQLAVASNKYQAAVRSLIGRFFPALHFTAVFGQREGVPKKPDPQVVFDILQSAGLAAGEALYVGDSGVDLRTASAAEVEACAVTWGFRPRAELESFHPAHIVDKAEEIYAIALSN